MADKAGQRSAAGKPGKGPAHAGFFGYDTAGAWLSTRAVGAGTGKDGGKGKSKAAGKGDGKGAPLRRGRVVIFGLRPKAEEAYAGWSELPAWVRERVLKKRGEVVYAPTDEGPLWLLMPLVRSTVGHGGTLDQSPYGALRDLAGLFGGAQLDHSLAQMDVHLVAMTDEEAFGALVGLEIGAYRYRLVRAITQGKPEAPKLPVLAIVGTTEAVVEQAERLSVSVNLARHLVNVPPSELNPKTYGEAIKQHFARSSTMSVEIWDAARLTKEGMGLLNAVGNGAEFGPALVCLKYRPKTKTKGRKPIAFVGKGITFDSGGLDLKDAASMRLMKKDMGGSASLVGLAHWVEATQLGVPCDFYLALAENAVDERSFRPSDVITSRAGITVEIDNTDAEGRLVLADALDVAIKGDGEAPEILINLATLTGAMRIALGTRLAGMFATDDSLAERLLAAAQRRADPTWRMPLVAEYMNQLKSTTADLANSGPGRFGGAITAALFLQRFVGNVPWAHFDMYGWTDAGIGGTTETGGNGQCVQLLSEYLLQLA